MRGMLHTSLACDWRDVFPLPMKLVLSLFASTTTHVQHMSRCHMSILFAPRQPVRQPPRAAQVDEPPVAPCFWCFLCGRVLIV